MQRGWAAAFPGARGTGLAADLMADLLDSLLVGSARQAGQRAGRQAEQVAEAVVELRGLMAAGGEGWWLEGVLGAGVCELMAEQEISDGR